ncbi:DNA polymerase III subunit gamma/tau [Chitinimonas sp.]|uniref:DNA polymerase III subunit gamma/tau n=1 Tax=Chitinimonas sp. TaxID=1934313 RepID=UPI0035B48A08
MSYQVLARKWRPKSFGTLVGQEHVIKALSNALEQQRLHHAYLLTGTRGVGKTTIARILAKSLNCETGITATPCGQCSACAQIDAGRFVDLLEIDAASNTGIDNIREVLDNAQYAPTQGRFKVYIIDEVHMLSKSAFNAMLKTLEEPPGHVKFILATTDPQKVPVTILSRCLQFSLRQMLPQQVSEHLLRVLDAEQIPYEPSALTLLGHAAEGSMRDALSLLDQAIAYGSGRVEEAGVRAMLGAVDRSYLFALLTHLANRDGATVIALAQQLSQRGISADAALHELASLLHQLALYVSVPGAIAHDLPHFDALSSLASAFSPEALQLNYQIALHGRRDLPLAPDEFAGLSMTLLRMLAFAPSNGIPAKLDMPTPAHATSAAANSAPVAAPTAPPAAEATAFPGAAMQTHEQAMSIEVARTAVTTTNTAPAAPSEPPDTRPNRQFSGDWAQLISEMRPGGLAGMLAQHAVLNHFDERQFHLGVPDAHKVVAGADYKEKLEYALSEHLGTPIRLQITVGGGAEATPAAQLQRERQAGIAAAEAAINADPFAQALMVDFGATIVPDSIRPQAPAA